MREADEMMRVVERKIGCGVAGFLKTGRSSDPVFRPPVELWGGIKVNIRKILYCNEELPYEASGQADRPPKLVL
jgi:hypothetical protein